jgi:ABC-type transport system involved in multi-copper enzyme maturation permease subunit
MATAWPSRNYDVQLRAPEGQEEISPGRACEPPTDLSRPFTAAHTVASDEYAGLSVKAVGDILKKELFEHIHSGRLHAGLILLTVVTPLLVSGLVQNHKAQVDQTARVATAFAVSLAPNAPYSYIKVRALIEPDLRQIFNAGVMPELRRDFVLSRRDDPVPNARQFIESPTQNSFAFSDARLLFQVIFPLIAIAVSFSLVSGERENGTLRLLCANPIPRRHVILGKMVAGFFALSALLAYTHLLILLTLRLWKVALPQGFGVMMLQYFGVNLLWVFLFFLIGIFLSALLLNSAWALTFALATWLLIVIILPAAVPQVLTRASRYVSQYEVYQNLFSLYGRLIRNAQELAGSVADVNFARVMEKDMACLPEYAARYVGVGKVRYGSDGSLSVRSNDEQDLAAIEGRLRRYMDADKQIGRSIYEVQIGEFQKLVRQTESIERSTLFSPFNSYNLLTSQLSGTDIESYAQTVAKIGDMKETYFRSLESTANYVSRDYFLIRPKPQPPGSSTVWLVPMVHGGYRPSVFHAWFALICENLLALFLTIVIFAKVDPR